MNKKNKTMIRTFNLIGIILFFVLVGSSCKYLYPTINQVDSSKQQAVLTGHQVDSSKQQAVLTGHQVDSSKQQADLTEQQADSSKQQAVLTGHQVDSSKQQADLTEQQVDSSIHDNCNLISCIVNGKKEYISCDDYISVLNRNWAKKIKLDKANKKNNDLQIEIAKLKKRTKSRSNTFDINSVDNLSIDIFYQNKSYSIYIVNPKRNKITLYNQYANKKIHDFRSIKSLINKQNGVLLFAMNAGMYDKNKEPIGLFISNGKKKHEINLKVKASFASNFYDLDPNGILAIDENNTPYLIKSTNYNTLLKGNIEIKLATQSGPMMVIDGSINKHFRKGSTNLNIRNGVGVNSLGKLVFVISNQAVNFYEFSELFLNILDCSNALYLDGLVSKVYHPELDKTSLDKSNHLGPIITVEK